MNKFELPIFLFVVNDYNALFGITYLRAAYLIGEAHWGVTGLFPY